MKLDDANTDTSAFTEQPNRAAQPLRIALVTETYPPEINGVAMTLGRMVTALRERGHIVDITRPRQAHERQHEPQRATQAAGSDHLVKGLPIPGYPELRFGLPATTALKNRWRANRPDIVHIATQGPLGWSARNAARSLGIAVSSSFHTNFDSYSRHYGVGWMKPLIASVLRKFHNGTDATMVPTRSLAGELACNGLHNTSVISRGIDTRLFNPLRRSANLRSQWEARPDDLVVAYVGRIAAEKNMDMVFAAFAEIQCARHDARLVLVGDGPMLNALKKRYPQHIFSGMQRGEALAAHYASADLFLFPSLTETFGNVTVEAMASGLGVVAYQYAAAAELIDDGHNGLLAAIDDPNGFINSAVALATNRALLSRMRLRAVASVSHLHWAQIGDDFTTRLRAVIKAHDRKQRARDALIIAAE